MKVLSWRDRGSNQAAAQRILSRAVGEYAGRARYSPRGDVRLNPTLARAVGQVIALRFDRIASPDEPFTGQALYREHSTRPILGGWLIPEQDLHFVD